MKEAIISKYGGQTLPTHNRGSVTIDEIFVSLGITIFAGGFLDFEDGIPSDHRAAWIDIEYSEILRHSLPPIIKPKTRRLHCNHPRVKNHT
mmetsp:Transcript_30001/g.45923  ORF Transcript_30001/g.45923 Transcript_30001/m.45923 type:complete len:91 (-) Transcript_30001:16-288(-)